MCEKPFIKNGTRCPCGKCEQCRKRYASGWAFRIAEEAERLGSAFFVTLTYENAPMRYEIPAPEPVRELWHPPLCYPKKKRRSKFTYYQPTKRLTCDICHLQRFFKRLRKSNLAKEIKYYAVSEYGGVTQRPHYHAIILGMDIVSFLGVENWDLHCRGKLPFDGAVPCRVKDWIHGNVTIGMVNNASINYTLKYIQKGRKIPMYKGDDRQPEKSVMSKGMGLSYITPAIYKYHRQNLELQYVINNEGMKISIPRYLKERLYDSAERRFVAELMIQREIEERENMGQIELDRMYKLKRTKVDNVGVKNKYNSRDKL